MNLNLPRGFTLERVVAILRAVHPKGVPVSKGSKGVVDKVVMALAELERLRLVVPADGGGRTGENDGGGGVLHEERRWKVNVPRGFVEELGNMYQKEGLAGLLREFELVDAV